MSELLTAVQCCCDPLPVFEGQTWFEVRPLVERTKFRNGFRAWGAGPDFRPRFLALFNYNTIPEDYIFYGSCGQFWILKDPVCSISEYILDGGTYIEPGTDPEVFGCGFEYPENLIVQPRLGFPFLPPPSNYEILGGKWTDLVNDSPTRPEPNLYASGNLLTSAWEKTGYFRPNMSSLEGEFLDIDLKQEGSGREYSIRYSPVEKLWQADGGGFNDEPFGRINNSPYAEVWYNMKKFVTENGSFSFNLQFLGGLQNNIKNSIDLVPTEPPCRWCCQVVQETEFDACTINEDGRWTGSGSGVVAIPTPQGGACGTDVDTPTVYGSAILLIRGTQVVQTDGQPTELAVPKNGMGDVPRILDTFVLRTGFTFLSKKSVPSEDQQDCFISNYAGGPGGEAFREWRVQVSTLLGTGGGFLPSDSVEVQFFYGLVGGQVVQSDPVFIRPVIQNSHSPVDGGRLARIVYGPYDDAFPEQETLLGVSSGVVCTQNIADISVIPDECQNVPNFSCLDDGEPFNPIADCSLQGFPGLFTISSLSVSY